MATDSGVIGMYTARRAPRGTPRFSTPFATRCASRCSSPYVILCGSGDDSEPDTIATWRESALKQLSAMFIVAPGSQAGRSGGEAGARGRGGGGPHPLPRRGALTPPNSPRRAREPLGGARGPPPPRIPPGPRQGGGGRGGTHTLATSWALIRLRGRGGRDHGVFRRASSMARSTASRGVFTGT